MLLAEGATAGSGLLLQDTPSVSYFRFCPQVMRTQVKALVGVSPAPSEPWTHSCGGGEVLELQGDEWSATTCTTVRSRAGPTRHTAQS